MEKNAILIRKEFSLADSLKVTQKLLQICFRTLRTFWEMLKSNQYPICFLMKIYLFQRQSTKIYFQLAHFSSMCNSRWGGSSPTCLAEPQALVIWLLLSQAQEWVDGKQDSRDLDPALSHGMPVLQEEA